jgi:ornithine--oxo-acid transaminase
MCKLAKRLNSQTYRFGRRDHKILSQVASHAGHTIKLLPSLVISGADCEAILKAFAAVLAESERVPGAVWSLGKALVGNALRANA